jgi:hypothetical protein
MAERCENAHLVAKIPHDLRRTAVRNLARIGVDRKTAMEMVGHKTKSIYRYTITDEAMLRDASARLAVLHEAEREKKSQSTAKVREGSAPQSETPHALTQSQVGTGLVAWDGVEPPTRGFSVASGRGRLRPDRPASSRIHGASAACSARRSIIGNHQTDSVT